MLLAIDAADGFRALVECRSSGGPAVLVDVEGGAEVRGAQSLDDGDALGVLVGGLGDFVADDPAEAVLGSGEGEQVGGSGAVRVGVGEPVGSTARHPGLVVVAGDHERRRGQLLERGTHEREVLLRERVQVVAAEAGGGEEDAGGDAAVGQVLTDVPCFVEDPRTQQ